MGSNVCLLEDWKCSERMYVEKFIENWTVEYLDVIWAKLYTSSPV